MVVAGGDYQDVIYNKMLLLPKLLPELIKPGSELVAKRRDIAQPLSPVRWFRRTRCWGSPLATGQLLVILGACSVMMSDALVDKENV